MPAAWMDTNGSMEVPDAPRCPAGSLIENPVARQPVPVNPVGSARTWKLAPKMPYEVGGRLTWTLSNEMKEPTKLVAWLVSSPTSLIDEGAPVLPAISAVL